MKMITPIVLLAAWLLVTGCGTSNSSYQRNTEDQNAADYYAQQGFNDLREATRAAEGTRIANEDIGAQLYLLYA